jgi:hypothetical protein
MKPPHLNCTTRWAVVCEVPPPVGGGGWARATSWSVLSCTEVPESVESNTKVTVRAELWPVCWAGAWLRWAPEVWVCWAALGPMTE